MRKYLVIGGLMFYCGLFFSGSPKKQQKLPPYLIDTNIVWVDSVLNTLTIDEKIGQLFMVPAYSNHLAENVLEIENLIENYHIGGILFFQGSPVRQAMLTNKYQEKSKIPLLVAIDAEYGLGMRLDSAIKYPRQMTLGAIQNDSLIYNMGAQVAQQLKLLGIHVNLAPVADISNNPKNPVINSRSFGESREDVTRKTLLYMHGLQQNGIIATAKHFPGHGDTDEDSHEVLPVLNYSRARLNEVELFPFKALIDEGIGGVMLAHMFVPALDSVDNMASTLSPRVVKGVLHNELGFKGLTYTDALNMKGVSESSRKGDIDMEAFLAGNDILLFPDEVSKGVKKIKKAIKDELITEAEINRRVKKILLAKHWVGLSSYKPIHTKNLIQKINHPQFLVTNKKMVEQSLTLLKNQNNLLPFTNLDTLKMASLSIGDTMLTEFQKGLSNYAEVSHFNLPNNFNVQQQSDIIKKLEQYNLIFISIHNTKESPTVAWNISPEAVSLIKYLDTKKPIVLTLFSNAYSLKLFDDLQQIESLIMAYQDLPTFQEMVPQAIFGATAFQGKLPVTPSMFFKRGDGLNTKTLGRFKYVLPEEIGINSNKLIKIDSLIAHGIKERAFPGCQIFAAKDGKVFFNKSYGHHTYEEKIEVKNSDIYDVASITKIASSLAALMKLQDEGKISLDFSLCDYLPDLVENTPYFGLKLREILSHQAGLKPFIPFYSQTLVGGHPRYEIYSIVPSETFPYRVSNGLYIHKNYPDSILKQILNTPLEPGNEYKYSDVGYYFIQAIVERITGMSLNEYVYKTFYKPLGMATTGYLPRTKFPLNRIPPTEYDLMYRKQLVHGDVHDPGAAMMGGVAGHAGLFSSANDLAKIMQLYLNWGTFAGKQYLTENTIKEYAKCQYCETNRRGAGFDKPVKDGGSGPTCNCVSYDSFGHLGFTGTIAWADPETKVVYVFLSNRVYPSAAVNKLSKLGTRTKVMDVLFDAVKSAQQPL